MEPQDQDRFRDAPPARQRAARQGSESLGWTLAVAAVLGVFLAALWGLGVALPSRYIGDGLDAFEGAEKAAASRALFDVTEYYGNGFLEIGDYNGPPLVLGWRVEAAEGCPGAPFGEEAVGANARIEAYGPFGLPRGEMEVACRGERVWESYW